MIDNTYRVPKRQWNKWNDSSKYIFNELFEHIKDNQELYLHVQNKIIIDKSYWEFTAWNAAFMAAHIAKNATSVKEQ